MTTITIEKGNMPKFVRVCQIRRICQIRRCPNEAVHYIGKWVCDKHFNKHYKKRSNLML
jgi:hypothetical protein